MTATQHPSEPYRDALLGGKVAMISGVGAGLGRQTALAFARHGAAVALGARTADHIESVAADIRDMGGAAIAVRGDITDPGYGERFLGETVEELGHVDCLVNNAARGPFVADAFSTLVEADLGAWRETLEVNLFATLRLTRSVAASMKDAGRGGSVVFVNTVGIWTTPPRQGAYVASKAGLFAMAQVLAKELGPDGIRVNTVAPGWMLGPPVRGLLEARAATDGTSYQEEYDKIAAGIPLGRIPTDAECAGAIVFLASDLSSALTGQCIDVNGGQVSR